MGRGLDAGALVSRLAGRSLQNTRRINCHLVYRRPSKILQYLVPFDKVLGLWRLDCS